MHADLIPNFITFLKSREARSTAF